MSQASDMSHNPRRLIKVKEVCVLLGVSRTTHYRITCRDRTFPAPIKDGQDRQAPVYYNLAEVEAWVQARMDRR